MMLSAGKVVEFKNKKKKHYLFDLEIGVFGWFPSIFIE